MYIVRVHNRITMTNDLVTQLQQDVQYATETLGCTLDEADELIAASENLGLNVQYFVEEFILGGMEYHDKAHLNINDFNDFHGIQLVEEQIEDEYYS